MASLARKLALLVVANAAAGCFALFTLDGYDEPLVTPSGELVDAAHGSSSGDTPLDPTLVPGADAGRDADAMASGKLIFVTDDEVPVGDRSTGSFTGITAANDLCNAAARRAGLQGQFRAWLTDEQGSPPGFPTKSGDFQPSTEPLVTLDHRLVAFSYDDLRDAGPRVAIAITELGKVLADAPAPPAPEGNVDPRFAVCPPSGLVWTGAGTITFSVQCLNWTSPSAELTGSVGRITKDPVGWVWTCNLSCASKARLYCFET